VLVKVKIPSAVMNEMLAHAREAVPNECCGLIVGRRGEVESVIRARNLETIPTRYLIDPQDHFAAIKTARAQGLRVTGAYHSHPSGEPVPSASDIAEASGGRDFLYVIVSPVTGGATGYFVDNGSAILVDLG
jgi:proteasome lid subunit RPN8/RPN11